MTTPGAKFWINVNVAGETECWPWNLRVNKKGRGIVQWEGKKKYASRVAFELVNGHVKDNEVIMHTCDNPGCCNPAHLKRGTQQQNVQDAVNKGRTWSKLTKDQVAAIKSDVRTNMAIAKDYGVNHRTVSAIKTGIIWVHVNQ